MRSAKRRPPAFPDNEARPLDTVSGISADNVSGMRTTTSNTARPTAAVTVRDLNHGFVTGKKEVVEAIRSLSLTVEVGEFVCVVGPSGCGKTTLLRIIAGLEAHHKGEVTLGHKDGLEVQDARRLPTTVVFQQDSTLPWLRVAENVSLGMSGLPLDRSTIQMRVQEYLSLVGLSQFSRAYPHELSGGMRQRVAIARALAPEPLLLLMDEPLAALDAQTRLVMQAEILRIVSLARSSVLYITHDVEEALTLGDRVIVMSRRPAVIKTELTTPWAQFGGKGSMDILSYRAKPEVAQLSAELFRLLREEVGESL